MLDIRLLRFDVSLGSHVAHAHAFDGHERNLSQMVQAHEESISDDINWVHGEVHLAQVGAVGEQISIKGSQLVTMEVDLKQIWPRWEVTGSKIPEAGGNPLDEDKVWEQSLQVWRQTGGSWSRCARSNQGDVLHVREIVAAMISSNLSQVYKIVVTEIERAGGTIAITNRSSPVRFHEQTVKFITVGWSHEGSTAKKHGLQFESPVEKRID